MNKKISLSVLVLLVLSTFGGVASSQEFGVVESSQVIQAVPTMESFDTQNFTKLEISPRYGNAQLQPGENREMTVTIKNKETKSIKVSPIVVVPPYGEYLMDKEWITVSPASIEIPAGGSQKFTIKVVIPADASIGYYNANIAFTDEKMPTPYPEPFPNYVHSYSLSINLWTPPTIQISNPYINDQLEAGKEYDYKIKLKNTGDKAVAIDPKMSQQNQMYGGPFGMMASAFTDDAVTITSPKEIPAGGSIEVNVHIKVPADAKGNYQGGIDLGIDDPSIRDEWADMVNLMFGVWRQPTEAYVKTFNAKEAASMTIEVSSNLGVAYGYYGSITNTKNKKDPSFAVTLTGSGNNAIPLTKIKTIIKGGVSLGGMNGLPPWESESEGIYQEMGTQYIETYKVDVPAGDLKLGIIPQNTQQFEYTISMGNN
ncbi:MAG: hypothetical protein KKG76_14095 [Euryarchaeota archaeon]|nr:hypothetical protein [Euryarchaeota archaeon]